MNVSHTSSHEKQNYFAERKEKTKITKEKENPLIHLQ
jgi:hypothetical protein